MKKYYKKIYNVSTNKRVDIKREIKKRYKVLYVFCIALFSILVIGLFNTQIVKNELYQNKLEQLSKNIVYSNSTPRGRIYDRNGNIIVDNEAVKVIFYKKTSGVTTSEEISMAYKVSELIEIDYNELTENDLKKFIIYKDIEYANSLITEEEYILYEERKLTSGDLFNLKLERIGSDIINNLTELDKEAAYIYDLMNTGYSTSDKTIKSGDVTEEEYAIIANNLNILPGFDIRLDWERVYPYGDVLKTLLGTVSSSEAGLPYELKDYYLDLGYSLDDRVGTSYLEFQYESLLKGEKTSYELLSDGTKKIIDEGSRGNDIVLSIDIELQKEVEQILKEEILSAKNDPNTEYYDKSFAIISDPNTGEILAMAGKKLIETDEGYEIIDYSSGLINYAFTAGSVVKGASHIAGYNNGALQIGEVRSDNCIKIAATPEKCSWTNLGYTNDITALQRSSNVFQYKTAINLGKGNYVYDQALSIDPYAFTIYRDTFASFGLGVLTGIDLPLESSGYQGNSDMPGHLLDFSIGQFDTYTPIQLSQYINTIANDGYRLAPTLLKAVYEPTEDELTELIFTQEVNILNKLDTEDIYLDRVQEGFREAMKASGTGYSFINYSYNAAGKTGTAESFLDTDNDGMIDKETMSNAFVSYAPYDDPEVSFTVISPDIYYQEGNSTTRSGVNRKISYRISEKYFKLYE